MYQNNTWLAIAFITIALLMLPACTVTSSHTYTESEDIDAFPESIRGVIESGESVYVFYRGVSRKLRITGYEENNFLVGTDVLSGQNIKIPLDDIKRMRVKREKTVTEETFTPVYLLQGAAVKSLQFLLEHPFIDPHVLDSYPRALINLSIITAQDADRYYTREIGPVEVTIGQFPKIDRLERELERGVSTTNDVERVLGKPSGYGRALSGIDGIHRDVWYYEETEASVIDSKSYTTRMHIDQQILMIFFREDKLDGFQWFSNAVAAKFTKPGLTGDTKTGVGE